MTPAIVVPPSGAPAAVAPPAPAATPAPAPAPGGGGRGLAPPATVNNQTLRQIVRTSIGGSKMRVVLSNAYGTAPVQIGGAAVALRDKDASIQAPSLRTLLFDGAPVATILAGATLVSDPVDLPLAPLSEVALDLLVPGAVGVPLSTPALLRLMPVGREPLVMSHRYGAVPPAALSVTEL